MFVIKVMYYRYIKGYEPDYSSPIHKEYEGEKISECMNAINSDRMHHDCAKYTPMVIYDVVDTSE